jgi:hypothetical protein
MRKFLRKIELLTAIRMSAGKNNADLAAKIGVSERHVRRLRASEPNLRRKPAKVATSRARRSIDPERALLARVNRCIAPEGLRVRMTRAGSSERVSHGRFYLADTRAGGVVQFKVDLPSFAHQRGADVAYRVCAVKEKLLKDRRRDDEPPASERIADWLYRQWLDVDQRRLVERLIEDLRRDE